MQISTPTEAAWVLKVFLKTSENICRRVHHWAWGVALPTRVSELVTMIVSVFGEWLWRETADETADETMADAMVDVRMAAGMADD